MTWKGDRFYIIGGLPLKHEKNYVYEYTPGFKLVKRHDLETGFTWMGIQTAAYEDNTFYFGIYGSKGAPSGVLACPEDLSSYKRYTCGGSVGILKLDGAYYVGSSPTDKKTGRRTGYLTRQKEFPSKPFTLVRVQQQRQQAAFLAGRAFRLGEGRQEVQGVPRSRYLHEQGVLHARPRARRTSRGPARRHVLAAPPGHS